MAVPMALVLPQPVTLGFQQLLGSMAPLAKSPHREAIFMLPIHTQFDPQLEVATEP